MQVLVSDSTVPKHGQMFGVPSALARLTEISEDHLRDQLRKFLESMSKVVAELPEKCGPFDVTELQILVQVSASGGIELVGKIDTGVSGGLNIRLTRGDG